MRSSILIIIINICMLLLYVVNIQAIELQREEDTATSITVEINELQKKKSPSYSIKCAAFLEGTQVQDINDKLFKFYGLDQNS